MLAMLTLLTFVLTFVLTLGSILIQPDPSNPRIRSVKFRVESNQYVSNRASNRINSNQSYCREPSRIGLNRIADLTHAYWTALFRIG